MITANGTPMSKVLYRLLEIKELMEDTIEFGEGLPDLKLIDAFGGEEVLKVEDLIELLRDLTKHADPRLEKGEITSEWDSLQADREKLERMQDVAIGLLDFIPLDRFRQDDLVKLIYKSDQETCKYIENLPVVAGLQPHLF